MERWGEGAYFKVDPNMQRPPEKDSCIERRLLDGAKLPLRGMKSASWKVGAALAKPLTAAAQQLFGGRVTGKGAVSQLHGAHMKAQPPGDRVSAACAISNSASPAKPCWVTSLARDPGRRMGSGYPKELGAKPQEAAPWGGGRRRRAHPCLVPPTWRLQRLGGTWEQRLQPSAPGKRVSPVT